MAGMTKADATSVESLIEQMNRIRNVSEIHVADMHHEAGRLVDWREHVRSRPLVSVAAAVMVGFSLIHRSRSSNTHTDRKLDAGGSTPVQASVATGVMSFAGALVSSMVKNYVLNYVRQQLHGDSHDLKRSDRRPVSERNEREEFLR